MNLVDRYVNEVGRRLPRKQREDVKMELRSTLEDSLEDRVDGEPSEEDVEAVLIEFGSPEKVAASYQPSGQYLVGPDMFPFFKIVIGAVLLAVSINWAEYSRLSQQIHPSASNCHWICCRRILRPPAIWHPTRG